MLVSFKPYGRGESIYIETSRIVCTEEYSSNSDTGSRLYMDDGREILVGNWPSEVATIVNRAVSQGENNG